VSPQQLILTAAGRQAGERAVKQTKAAEPVEIRAIEDVLELGPEASPDAR